MGNDSARHPIALKPVVYRLDGMESVAVRRDLEYASCVAGALTLDLYRPPLATDGFPPLVLLVTGYADVGVPRPLGCAVKEMQAFVSMAQLLALSGMAVVTYTTRQPAADVHRVLDYTAAHAAALGIDRSRVALWATSGHAPVALATLVRRRNDAIRAVVLSNGFTLDIEGSLVADAARTWQFDNAAAGITVRDLPAGVAAFVVRSGRDEIAGLNDALDRFVAQALAHNLPLTVVNHPTAPHAFDVNDDSAVSRHTIRQMIAFLQFWLARSPE